MHSSFLYLVSPLIYTLQQIGKYIGHGQFSVIYEARNVDTQEIVAIKQIPLLDLEEGDITRLMNRAHSLTSLSHPRIVKYEGAARGNYVLNIVLESVPCFFN